MNVMDYTVFGVVCISFLMLLRMIIVRIRQIQKHKKINTLVLCAHNENLRKQRDKNDIWNNTVIGRVGTKFKEG